jgi:hypothetical protein
MVPLKKIKLGFEISTSLHDFAVTVKSPVIVLLIIALTTSSLLYISCTNYTSIYLKADGTVQSDSIQKDRTKDGSYVRINVDKRYAGALDKQSPVIWYCDKNGRRYEGHIDSILTNADNSSLSIKVLLSGADVEKEHSKNVSLELLVKKVRIIDKLSMKAVEE